ncbi:hypothetical protein CFC21_067281 [Triticum aestivum]|uniref:Bromo domain-containing protein n=2 Tax=Triticum aestivum TaxID=4565 RepID=A0A3B6KNW0_WHEAT|nr:bromodomain-containing protein DDB_G0270170-like [Triticum aestivum]KAF7060489.1 hypothetical protein CFC21_067281 [Triticum aestivum]
MGKQQPPPRPAAMSAPPPARRKRKKKGRPSLLDLQKRSLRLQKLQEAPPPPPPPPPPPQQRRPSTRRNPAPEDDSGDDDPRREKKLRLVVGLHDGSAKGEKRRTATDGREEPSDSGPTTPLPDKKLLVFILDRLQKKDTYGVFSEPVDDEELPDYRDIVKHPMDFSTVRKKLDKGAYANLEQFEDDVFLITSNAMSYNSPDTVYYRQARSIQEVAKKDFENLRQDSDASEPEPEPLPEPEPKPQRRRGRPPKNAVKQQVEQPPAERATANFSAAALAMAGNSGLYAHSGFDIQRRIADVLKASFANRSNEHNWSSERKLESIEDYSGSGSKWSGKMGKKPLLVEESRRTTYYQNQPSSSMYELPVATSYNGTRKVLVPIGAQLPQAYSRSLARFAAQLGPVAWEVASKRIEQVIPPGITFGRGWVGDGESPNSFQPPVPTSSPIPTPPPSSTAASSEQKTVDDPASAGHSTGPHADAVSHAFANNAQRIDSQAVPNPQCGSLPQVLVDRGEHSVELKSSHNVEERPTMHQTVNGFNAVPGSIMFAPTVQLVANRMQTHMAD